MTRKTKTNQFIDPDALAGPGGLEYARERVRTLRQVLRVAVLTLGVAVNELPERHAAAGQFYQRMREVLERMPEDDLP